MRTVVAGIMSNVPVLSMQNLARIIEALSRTLNVNHRTILNDITSKIPLEDNNVQPIEVIDEEMQVESDADASLRRLKDDQPSGIDAEVKLVEYLLSAQRISAEILSNICTPDDDEMYEDVEDNSDVESVHDYDMAQQQNGNQPTADKIPVEVSEAVKSHQIVEKVSPDDPGSIPEIFFSTWSQQTDLLRWNSHALHLWQIKVHICAILLGVSAELF